MENKRLELVSRDSNDELNIAGHKDISQENRMCSCQDDVVKKMGTLEDDGACGDGSTAFPQKARRTYQRKS